MNINILSENKISFNEIEKNIFKMACETAQKFTKELLERIDDELAEQRDHRKFRDKGKRKTTIKTVFGEVEYSRRVYQSKSESGKIIYVYLLDEEIGMEKIGLISTNLVEKIVCQVSESPFRVTSRSITETRGQSISHKGVWNVVQALGETLCEKEEATVKEMEAGLAKGEKEIPVLFEEMDGIWLRMQGKNAAKAPKKEMKVATCYEGWDANSKNASRLACKTVIAGMEKSDEFLKKREAQISSIYNTDEIVQRILNSDGGTWIKDPYEPDVIQQLDRYHVVKEIRAKIAHQDYNRQLQKLLRDKEIDKLIEAVQIYADSVATGEEIDPLSDNAMELKKYLKNNKDHLLRYHERGLRLPKPPKGIVYKSMGVQENQNATVIAIRMKHGRKRWKEHSANNMAKLLYHNENGDLLEAVRHFTDGYVSEELLTQSCEILSAGKAPKKDGKGNPYIERFGTHMPIPDSGNSRSIKMFKRMIWGA